MNTLIVRYNIHINTMGYLLITESPAKAKKIQGFLSKEYSVKSSCGHIIDLEKKQLSIDVTNDFKPTYKVTSDKKAIVAELKQASKHKSVILAADDDREGEAIAWHCANTLKVDINANNRIVFREISKKAILKALKDPQKINMNEVNAQQARRIIDRLIGFKLSPCLWKHISTKELGLSAGRVQSALLNLLDRREKYILQTEPEVSLDIKGSFKDLKDAEFIFSSEIEEIDNELIHRLFQLFIQNRLFQVTKSGKTKEKSYPSKPFITSTLQQSAQNELGMSVKTTMDAAQRLYESGHITYMRTDSTFISEEFQGLLKTHITEKFGQGIYQKPNEKKVKGAQEAHEAIRPTKIDEIPEIDGYEKKLYSLILKRTITSHMKPAIYDVYKLFLETEETKEYGKFIAKYKILTFKGFLSYTSTEPLKSETMSFSKEYQLISCNSSEKEDPLPQLYNESAIVKLLEDTGIGRPSTYATIISTVSNRKYTQQETVKQEDREETMITLLESDEIQKHKKIIPGKLSKSRISLTPLGKQVLTYLQTNFMNVIDPLFTSSVEKDLDSIAEGKLDYINVIRKVYNSFISIVDKQMETSNQKSTLRELGTKSGKTIYVGKGKYGPYLQIVNEKGHKKNSSIEKYLEIINKNIDTISMEDCISFLKYPKKISKEITIYLGPHGYYIKYRGTTKSLPNDTTKHSLTFCEQLLT